MCDRNLATGFTEDGGTKTDGAVFAIAAHELGHIFNMEHDDGKWLTSLMMVYFNIRMTIIHFLLVVTQQYYQTYNRTFRY